MEKYFQEKQAMDVGERAVHYSGSLSDRRQPPSARSARQEIAGCMVVWQQRKVWQIVWQCGRQEQWWSCIRLSDLGQEHNCTGGGEAGARLASRTAGIHTFLLSDENTWTDNFSLKYISLERKVVCSSIYISCSLHKYEAISTARCGVYWSSGLFGVIYLLQGLLYGASAGKPFYLIYWI